MTQRSKKRTANELTASEEAWILIAKRKTFTIEDLVRETSISRVNAESLIQKLRQNSIIERVGRKGTNGQRGSWAQYRLIGQPGAIPDVVSTRTIAWRKQAWNALRIKRRVTVPEVMTTFTEDVTIAEDTVYRYLRRLEKAGYVVSRGRSGRSGQPMSHKQYVLAKDAGPTPPSRKQLLREIDAQEGRSDDCE